MLLCKFVKFSDVIPYWKDFSKSPGHKYLQTASDLLPLSWLFAQHLPILTATSERFRQLPASASYSSLTAHFNFDTVYYSKYKGLKFLLLSLQACSSEKVRTCHLLLVKLKGFALSTAKHFCCWRVWARSRKLSSKLVCKDHCNVWQTAFLKIKYEII